jgi:hypothetical protein
MQNVVRVKRAIEDFHYQKYLSDRLKLGKCCENTIINVSTSYFIPFGNIVTIVMRYFAVVEIGFAF